MESSVELEGCIVLNEHNIVFTRSGPLYTTGVSLDQVQSSTQTASRWLQPFLPGSLGDRPTDRPTERATWSVTIGRAHSGEAKFCYCFSIYWSSRLDRSDQLQQSAAIFSCKTRRVAVYVETHYNIASKRVSPIGVPER